MRSRTDFENVLGYKFKQQELLWQALTHASAVNEKHPMAFHRDLFSLAFIGDAVLKYAVARYLFLNGRYDIINSRAELHNGAQTIITNGVLAAIARKKLHLDEYLIRGNNHVALSKKMYADCMEAIFGAIALDCGSDQQVIFRVIERLCSQCYEDWLVETTRFRLLSVIDDEEDKWITEDNIAWPKLQLESALRDRTSTTPPHERSCLETLSRLCLYFFAGIGFIAFCYIIITEFISFYSKVSTKRQWLEL